MKYNVWYKRLAIKLLLICFISVSFQQAALAGLVSTSELLNEESVTLEKQRLNHLLSSEHIKSQLVSMGVNPEDAKKRLDNMTDEEIIAFSSRMNEMEAGSGVLELAVFVFLVLLVTDLLGYTDIFPFVKKTVK